MRKFLLLFMLFVVLGLSASTACAQSAPVLADDNVRLEFDPKSGALVSFLDLKSQHDFCVADAPVPLWNLDALDASQPVAASADATLSWQTHPRSLKLIWSDLKVPTAPDLRVIATVTLGESGQVRWRLELQGLTGFPLRSVHFPRLRIAPQPDEQLSVPIWMGETTSQARELLGSKGAWQWEYPGMLSMQCMSLCGKSSSLSMACADPEALKKNFAVLGDAQGLSLEVRHLPEADAERSQYELTYDVVLQPFQGNWFNAAQIYRKWAVAQTWVRDSRLRTARTPEWVRQTEAWVWNRGRSGGVLSPAVALAQKSGLRTSVFWHWWHGCAYDAGFPEYLPPREGEEPFKEALGAAQKAGVHALVYMNQRLWGMTTESWKAEGAEAWAVKGPDGKVRAEVYNTFMKAPCAPMCIGTQFWRDKYAGLSEAAAQGLGVDGIYMDQACLSLACYDPTHGHPLGGGAYWTEGFRLLEEDIRDRCPGVTLAGEGCGESWLPNLDLMLSLQVSMERYMAAGVWEPIPFFHAVYHDCGVFYGNYSSLTYPPYDDLWPAEFAPAEPLKLLDQKFSRQFRLEQARAFVWGQQPTIANFQPDHFQTRPEEMAYFLELAQLRSRCLKYLRDGQLLGLPDTGAPRQTIPMSRLSIYAGQQDAVKEFEYSAPSALASVWRAPDGSVAFVVANLADKPQTLRLPLNRQAYGLPAKGVPPAINLQGENLLLRLYDEDTVDIEVPLDAFEAVVFEVRPRS